MARAVKKTSDTPSNSLLRKILTALLLSAAGLALLLVHSAYWINHTIFDQATFTNIVTTSVTSESSRNAIAASTVDRVLADRPVAKRLAGDRLTALLSGLLGSDLGERAIKTVTE